MKINYLPLLIAAGFGALSLSSRAIAQSTPSSLGEQLVNTQWLLEDLGGQGVVDRVQTTVRFEEGDRISGSGGCNRYFADTELEGDRLSVGVIGATMRLCPPAMMDQEARFFQALESAQQIELDGPYLLISSDATDAPLRFTQLTDTPPATEPTTEPTVESLQLTSSQTLHLFHTDRYAVRIFQTEGQLRLNLYNTQTQRLEVNGAPITAQPNPEGTDYVYEGNQPVKIFVANSGEQILMINNASQGTGSDASISAISGTVIYLPRIALPPEAVVEVSLLDVSRQDVAADVLATTILPTYGRQVPIPFQLTYDADRLEPQRTYSLQAKIFVDGELRFITTTHTPVTPENASEPFEILVQPV